MKVAVSALGPTLDAQVDERFGRAAYLLVHDTESGGTQIIDNNDNRNALQGAGLGAAESVGSSGATVVLTGHLGPKAYRALQLAGVSGFGGAGMTARQAIEAYERGELAPLSEGEAHSGME